MNKQPIKKKEFTSNSDKMDFIKKFKQEKGLNNVKQKEQEWLVLPPAFQEATQCVGLPLSTVSCVKGHTNVGKSTFVFEAIKACQKQGIVPVVFDLENAFKWDHAKDIGVEIGEYVDEETGEIIYGPGDDIIYYDTSTLYEHYGKYDHENNKWLTKPNREVYVIEDVALCIRDLLRQQKNDELPFDLFFIIDSIGVGDCYRAAVKNGSNNMWFAGALSSSFNVIGNDLIPSSRNVTSKYNNSMFYVNKIWVQTTPTGLPSAKTKGGNSFTYFTRFSIFLGNQGSSGIKRQSLTYKGEDYEYGIKVNISIDKNHITDVLREGTICSTKNGLCSNQELESYKEEYKKYLKESLSEKEGKTVSLDDFETTEKDDE